LPSGQQVTSFGIATNRFYTDSSGQKKQEAEFHNIVCFGKLADISSRYLTKGSLILIEGRIKTRNWVNTQGVKQYRTEIIADSLQLGPKGAAGGSGGYNKSYAPEEQSQGKIDNIPVIEENYAPPMNNEEPKEEGEIDVKDIPF
jgi:single-strand DNA-binding protein